jgi:uncharacterized protein
VAGLQRDPAPEGPVVRAFVGTGFAVGETHYPALLMTPAAAFQWAPPAIEELGETDLAALLALDPLPEFIVLGTGHTHRQPPRALRAALDARGIGLEIMDSRAAARAWGMLRGEMRWIAAALMPL